MGTRENRTHCGIHQRKPGECRTSPWAIHLNMMMKTRGRDESVMSSDVSRECTNCGDCCLTSVGIPEREKGSVCETVRRSGHPYAEEICSHIVRTGSLPSFSDLGIDPPKGLDEGHCALLMNADYKVWPKR